MRIEDGDSSVSRDKKKDAWQQRFEKMVEENTGIVFPPILDTVMGRIAFVAERNAAKGLPLPQNPQAWHRAALLPDHGVTFGQFELALKYIAHTYPPKSDTWMDLFRLGLIDREKGIQIMMVHALLDSVKKDVRGWEKWHQMCVNIRIDGKTMNETGPDEDHLKKMLELNTRHTVPSIRNRFIEKAIIGGNKPEDLRRLVAIFEPELSEAVDAYIKAYLDDGYRQGFETFMRDTVPRPKGGVLKVEDGTGKYNRLCSAMIAKLNLLKPSAKGDFAQAVGLFILDNEKRMFITTFYKMREAPEKQQPDASDELEEIPELPAVVIPTPERAPIKSSAGTQLSPVNKQYSSDEKRLRREILHHLKEIPISPENLFAHDIYVPNVNILHPLARRALNVRDGDICAACERFCMDDPEIMNALSEKGFLDSNGKISQVSNPAAIKSEQEKPVANKIVQDKVHLPKDIKREMPEEFPLAGKLYLYQRQPRREKQGKR